MSNYPQRGRNLSLVQANSSIESLEGYLLARRSLMESRCAFFAAVRTWLHPDQRVDAQVLGDALHASPVRAIDDAHWIANPTRGYISVLEDAERGRTFRLSVLQLGMLLRVGLRVDNQAVLQGEGLQSGYRPRVRLAATFQDQEPLEVPLRGGGVQLDWTFAFDNLYNSVAEFETAVYRVGAVWEAGIQALTKGGV